MGWRARSEPVREYDGGQAMMLWLADTYEVVGRHADETADVPAVIDDPPPVLRAERRVERRVACTLAVAAAGHDTAETALGVTVDISVTGLQLVMDVPAVVGPIDVIVDDAVVSAKVVDHRELDDGRHSWHLTVPDADEAWLALVQRS